MRTSDTVDFAQPGPLALAVNRIVDPDGSVQMLSYQNVGVMGGSINASALTLPAAASTMFRFTCRNVQPPCTNSS